MSNNHPETKEALVRRLRRIEGQVKGIQKMIEEEKNCIEILTQVAAVRAAINKVGSLMLEKEYMTCIQDAVFNKDNGKSVNELALSFQRFMKFTD